MGPLKKWFLKRGGKKLEPTKAPHLSVSGPFLAMIILSLPRPPTGARSVPVVNCRNSLFCSSPNKCNVSQNSLTQHKVDTREVPVSQGWFFEAVSINNTFWCCGESLTDEIDLDEVKE